MGTDDLLERARQKITERKFTTLLTEPRAGVYLFFSFDLVNSTQFKSAQPDNWPRVITRFYELVSAELTTRVSSAIVWKYVGDEVLFYKEVIDKEDIHVALPAAYAALLATMDVLHKNYPSSRELLAVKGTVWIAEASPILPSEATKTDEKSRNVIVETGRSPAGLKRDFLGPDIDVGFRISKFALRRRLVVSAELACLLFRERAAHSDIEERLRIVSFQVLKGVWGGRHYPIVWYEADWNNIKETFLYDEHITSELAAGAERVTGLDSKLARIEKVFRDLGRSEDMDGLHRAVLASVSIPRSDSIEIEIPSDRFAEIHCAAVCFASDGTILAARRPPTKRRFPNCFEFGCGQLRLGESFADCLRRAYNDDFGVDLILAEALTPVSTFEIRDRDERRVIPGLIFLAEIKDTAPVGANFSREKHTEIAWLNPESLRLEPGDCVPGFKSTIQKAVAMRAAGYR